MKPGSVLDLLEFSLDRELVAVRYHERGFHHPRPLVDLAGGDRRFFVADFQLQTFDEDGVITLAVRKADRGYRGNDIGAFLVAGVENFEIEIHVPDLFEIDGDRVIAEPRVPFLRIVPSAGDLKPGGELGGQALEVAAAVEVEVDARIIGGERHGGEHEQHRGDEEILFQHDKTP